MEYRESIQNKLLANSDLLKLLAKNVATWDKSQESKKSSSILHVSRLHKDLKDAFVTLDFGESPRIDDAMDIEFYGEFMYIRAYIAKGSGYMKAVAILREIYKSLNDSDIDCDHETIVKLKHVSTSADLYDEGIGKDYKQATYRIYKLI